MSKDRPDSTVVPRSVHRLDNSLAEAVPQPFALKPPYQSSSTLYVLDPVQGAASQYMSSIDSHQINLFNDCNSQKTNPTSSGITLQMPKDVVSCRFSPPRRGVNHADASPALLKVQSQDAESGLCRQPSIHAEQRRTVMQSVSLTLLSAFIFVLTICLPYHTFSEPVFKALASILTVTFMLLHQITITGQRDTLTATAT